MHRAAPGTPVKIRWKPSDWFQVWAIEECPARSAVRRWFWSGNEEDVGETAHLKIPQPKGLRSRRRVCEVADREYCFSVSQSMRARDAQGGWDYHI